MSRRFNPRRAERRSLRRFMHAILLEAARHQGFLSDRTWAAIDQCDRREEKFNPA